MKTFIAAGKKALDKPHQAPVVKGKQTQTLDKLHQAPVTEGNPLAIQSVDCPADDTITLLHDHRAIAADAVVALSDQEAIAAAAAAIIEGDKSVSYQSSSAIAAQTVAINREKSLSPAIIQSKDCRQESPLTTEGETPPIPQPPPNTEI
ncbi:OLC1v1000798C1 [Oldenlandia corymbosa var. corymbosa]|uniref:OLC1v1000798C1 n=1 Tax=Oldenlandia corymbosa var. corymbosa TaxID=529605 RepID=A0AAV1D5B8_OLDCO|nr:OLC1v1000798C1 [Oldenlandia corymbosa var. corymbosa]